MTTVINALSVDVEDWAQSTLDHSLPITERARRSTLELLDLLAMYSVHGTFFVLGLFAEKFPDVVRQIKTQGHEVASHGYGHRCIFRQTQAEFAADVRRSIALLEDLTGEPILGYRAPDFSLTAETPWALDILADLGLAYDSSIFPARTWRYGIPGTPQGIHKIRPGLIEVPLSTVRFAGLTLPVAGGGYIRLVPARITGWAIRQINSERRPAVVYIHPYELDIDELDELPCAIPWRLRLSQGLNRRQTRAKLEHLFRCFSFGPISECVQRWLAQSDRSGEAP